MEGRKEKDCRGGPEGRSGLMGRGGKRPLGRILPPALLVLCLALVAALALYLLHLLLAGLQGLSPLADAPVVQLLWAGARRLGALLAPVLAPLLAPFLCLLLLCFLLYAARKLSDERRRFGKLGGGPACLLVLDALQEFCRAVLRHAPAAALLLLAAIALNSLLVSVGQVRRVADNLRRAKELGVMVRNLSRSEDIARITLLRQDRYSPSLSDVEKTYLIEILSEGGESVSRQELTLKGNRIAIDSITVNFEYSQIESGQRQNIAYPYRVYSELMKPDDALPLSCMFNDEELPVIYCLDGGSIFGMTEDVFFQRLKELFAIVKDEKQSRELGIRSANGTVNHFVMNPGEVYSISVEATGGLSVHKKVALD